MRIKLSSLARGHDRCAFTQRDQSHDTQQSLQLTRLTQSGLFQSEGGALQIQESLLDLCAFVILREAARTARFIVSDEPGILGTSVADNLGF